MYLVFRVFICFLCHKVADLLSSLCPEQCSNYHRARVGRGPPTSLNGPLLEENLGGQRGPPSAPYLCGSRGANPAMAPFEVGRKNNDSDCGKVRVLVTLLMSATDLAPLRKNTY